MLIDLLPCVEAKTWVFRSLFVAVHARGLAVMAMCLGRRGGRPRGLLMASLGPCGADHAGQMELRLHFCGLEIIRRWKDARAPQHPAASGGTDKPATRRVNVRLSPEEFASHLAEINRRAAAVRKERNQ